MTGDFKTCMHKYENNFHILLFLSIDLALLQIVVLKIKEETYPQFRELKIVYFLTAS